MLPPHPSAIALAGLLVIAGCSAPRCDAPTERRTYLVSSLRFEAPRGADAHGFDLDGLISDGDHGTRCVELVPDYDSLTTGDPGVDNAFAGLVRTLAAILEGVGSIPAGAPHDVIDFASFFARGEMLLAIDVIPLSDGGVRIALHHVAIDEPLRFVGERLASGQRVRSIAELTSFTRTAADLGAGSCRLVEVAPAFGLGGDPGAFPPVDLERVTHVRLGLTGTGAVHSLELGGSWSLDDVRTWAQRLDSGLSEDRVVEVVGGSADLQPSAGDPARCEQLSFGAIADVVQARMIESP